MSYALTFVFIEHTEFYEPIFVLINVFTLLVEFLLSTLLILTLTMRELGHWLSIVGMSAQNHFGDDKYGRTGLC